VSGPRILAELSCETDVNRLTRLIFPALVVIALYYAVFGGEYSIFEVRSAKLEAERVKAELAVLKAENDSLRAWADSLETDSATLERIARENMGMIRPGEVLYRFVTEGDSLERVDGGGGGTPPR
jgi:cell division protein FtsB